MVGGVHGMVGVGHAWQGECMAGGRHVYWGDGGAIAGGVHGMAGVCVGMHGGERGRVVHGGGHAWQRA